MRLAGIFACASDADHARRALLDAGVDGDRISITLSQGADDIAGEAPGQSFENQPGQSARDSQASSYAQALRAGDCALVVDVDGAAERDRLDALLRENGARQVARPQA